MNIKIKEFKELINALNATPDKSSVTTEIPRPITVAVPFQLFTGFPIR